MNGAERTFIGLGSNLEPRVEHLRYGVRRLSAAGELLGLSSVYETEPVGRVDQPRFLNMVLALRTVLPPHDLLALALEIERDRGRVRSFRNAPRTLDLDLLLYGDRVMSGERLTLPHPRMVERPFVLVPLLDLDPGLADPQTGRPYREALAALESGAGTSPSRGERMSDVGRESSASAAGESGGPGGWANDRLGRLGMREFIGAGDWTTDEA